MIVLDPTHTSMPFIWLLNNHCVRGIPHTIIKTSISKRNIWTGAQGQDLNLSKKIILTHNMPATHRHIYEMK